MTPYSKAVVAVLTAIVAIAAQLLTMGVLPDDVARWVTIGVTVIGAFLVYRVPNTQLPSRDPARPIPPPTAPPPTDGPTP